MPQLRDYTLKELMKLAFKDTDEGADAAIAQLEEMKLVIIDGWYDPDTDQVGFTYARRRLNNETE